MIFGFTHALRQLRRSSEGAGAARRLSGGAAQEIGFTSIMFRRRQSGRMRGQEFVVRGQDAVQSGPSKTSLASAGRPGAESIALRDHRLAEYANIEKVGRTRFFNLFRTAVSLHRLVTTIVCKPCPRGLVPPHLYKCGGKRLR